ncbi:MAG TPA: hypothetical protein VF060_11775, partial [Trebonia sp.]
MRAPTDFILTARNVRAAEGFIARRLRAPTDFILTARRIRAAEHVLVLASRLRLIIRNCHFDLLAPGLPFHY